MLTDPQALLGRHSKRSRVVWHPGSTPPYSSLWITVQRFLMLNQPTRCAFAQDFLVHPNAKNRISLDPHDTAGAVCPVRLHRFARALGEPLETFRYACVAQFPRAVWPFFGGFAVCPDCLREGFHSVLFSFDGLDCCPLHGVKLDSRICCGKISNTLVLNYNATPPSTCRCGAVLMAFAVARLPEARPERDRALGKVVDWLMQAGSRCWLGPQNTPSIQEPLTRFTQRITRMHIAMDLPGAQPRWMMSREASPWDPRTTSIMTFGSASMREPNNPQFDGSPWLEGRPTSAYAYQQTALGDFKAISRYLKHHILKNARCWIARFVRADDTRAVQALITAGGENARRAWALLIWWQTCIWDLKLENWLTFRPFRWVSVPGVPELAGQPSRRKTFLPDANCAQEWITRWISAIALLDFWCHTAQAAALDSASRLAMIGKGILGTRALPDWRLGIDQNNRLVLCIERLDKPCWRPAARQSKSERQAASRAGEAHRLEQLRSACAPPCLWFHGDTTEWASGAGPVPNGLRDGKRHRLLAATPKRWFAIFPWPQAPCAGRAFVARCLDLPLAATGSSPCHAVRNLKYAIKRYESLYQADATTGL